jgi:hypothetical protein
MLQYFIIGCLLGGGIGIAIGCAIVYVVTAELLWRWSR